MKLAPVLALALVAALAACSGKAGAPAASATGTQFALQGPPPPPFLQLVPGASESVAHSGRRRIDCTYDVAGSLQRLTYVERVTADGQGRYLIVPLSVEQPRLTPVQRELFDALQSSRQGFFFKYRDLRVRDLALFLENYAVTELANPPIVAGVACAEIEVRRRGGSGSSYRLAIDPRTGLVLRAIESDAQGREVSRCEFLDISFTPDLHDVAFHPDSHAWTPLSAGGLPAGLSLAAPQFLPDGFRELSSERRELGGAHYVLRAYGDGLESLFFLQRQDLPAGSGAPAQPLDRTSARTVRLMHLGPWSVAEVADAGCRLFVLGKISEDAVLQVLQSAL